MKGRNLTVRVSPDLYQQVSDLAKAKSISNTQLIGVFWVVGSG